jgi:probable addiction module antidote protein
MTQRPAQGIRVTRWRPGPAFIADAFGVVARARGKSEGARETSLSRQSLCKSLSTKGNPELATILKVVSALGLTLAARPAAPPLR